MATSCPGTIGYFVGPHSDLSTCISEWQSPLCVTRISAGETRGRKRLLYRDVCTATAEVGTNNEYAAELMTRTDVTRLQRHGLELPSFKFSVLVLDCKALHFHLWSHCCKPCGLIKIQKKTPQDDREVVSTKCSPGPATQAASVACIYICCRLVIIRKMD